MWRYKKRLWVCEECGNKVEVLSLSEDGKHVCWECNEQYNKTQKEFDEEFDLNLNIETKNIEDLEEFNPKNPKYYL